MSALADSPFTILGATLHDDRHRIHSLAEEKSLEYDEEIVQKARLELTNPKIRIIHEIRWLLGTNPGLVKELMRLSQEEPFRLIDLSSIPKISQFNLLSESLRWLSAETESQKIVELITVIGFTSGRLFPVEIRELINEDRSRSGFPSIESEVDIDSEVEERRRECVDEIIGMLDRLPSVKLISVMTDVVDVSTVNGSSPANAIVDALVDRYELETRKHLDKEASNIDEVIETIKEQSKNGEDHLQPLLDHLEKITKNWDRIAQPIQVSTKARGLEHEASQEIAYNIRSLAIMLFNEYSMIQAVRFLNDLVSDVFAELPDVIEKLEDDVETIEDIISDRE